MPIPPELPDSAFRYSTIYTSEDFTVAITAPTIQQLAAAWRTIAQSTKLNPALVNEVVITPREE